MNDRELIQKAVNERIFNRKNIRDGAIAMANARLRTDPIRSSRDSLRGKPPTTALAEGIDPKKAPAGKPWKSRKMLLAANVLLLALVIGLVGAAAKKYWLPADTDVTSNTVFQSIDVVSSIATYIFVGTEVSRENVTSVEGYQYRLYTYRVDRMLKEGYPWDGGEIVIKDCVDSRIESSPNFDWSVLKREGAEASLLFVTSQEPMDQALPGNDLVLGISLAADGSVLPEMYTRQYLAQWLPEINDGGFCRDPYSAVARSPGSEYPPYFRYHGDVDNDSADLEQLVDAADLVVRTRFLKRESNERVWCRLDRIGKPLKQTTDLPLPDIVNLETFQPESGTEYLLFLVADGYHFYPIGRNAENSIVSEHDPVRWQAALDLLGSGG